MVSIRRESPGKASSSKPKAKKESSFLDTITDASDDLPSVGKSIVLYGKEGVGKTSLAAYFPKPLFIVDKNEQGIRRLIKQKLVPSSVRVGTDMETWQQLLDAIAELRDGSHDFETVALDSLTGMQRLCFQACCDAEFEGDMSKEGFFAFQSGPKIAAQSYWPELLSLLTDLQDQNIHTILLGHTVVKTLNNAEGPDYDRVTCDVDKLLWSITARWAGAVFYYRHNIDISKEKGERKMKGSGGAERYLCTEFDAAYDAKNSFGLPPILEAFPSAEEVFNDLWPRLNPESRPAKKKKSV